MANRRASLSSVHPLREGWESSARRRPASWSGDGALGALARFDAPRRLYIERIGTFLGRLVLFLVEIPCRR
jgi:hypothetical protein